jgi:Arc/MetJ family transcription regulator
MRTNVVIDDELMSQALRSSGCRTKWAAIETGLRLLVQLNAQQGLRALKGKVGWEGCLEEMRGGTWGAAVHTAERIKNVKCTRDNLRVDLLDGRAIIVPLAWYPRLLHATSQERSNWKVAGGGYGIHWPDVDEDLSVEGLLRGLPARGARPRAMAAATSR